MAAVIFNGDYVKTLKEKIKLKDGAQILSVSGVPSEAATEGSIALSDNGKHYRMVNSQWIATSEFDKDNYFQYDLDSFGSITDWTTIGNTVVSEETTTPLKGKKSLKYTQVATSAVGDKATLSYFPVPEQAKDNNTHILKFRCRLDSANDRDFAVNIIGVAATVRSTVEIVNGKTTVNKIFTYNSADTNLGLQVEVLTANDGASITIDSIEFSDSPFGEASLEKKESTLFQDVVAYGSVDTKIARFGNIVEDSSGELYKATTTVDNGTVIEVLRECVIAVSCIFEPASASHFGISRNSNELDVNITAQTVDESVLAVSYGAGSAEGISVSCNIRCVEGDKIRPHGQGIAQHATVPFSNFSVTASATQDYVTVQDETIRVNDLDAHVAEDGTLSNFNGADNWCSFVSKPNAYTWNFTLNTDIFTEFPKLDSTATHEYNAYPVVINGTFPAFQVVSVNGSNAGKSCQYDLTAKKRGADRIDEHPMVLAAPKQYENDYDVDATDAGVLSNFNGADNWCSFDNVTTTGSFVYNLNTHIFTEFPRLSGFASNDIYNVNINYGAFPQFTVKIRRNDNNAQQNASHQIVAKKRGADRTPAGVIGVGDVKQGMNHSTQEFWTGDYWIDDRKIYARTYQIASDITATTTIDTIDTGLEIINGVKDTASIYFLGQYSKVIDATSYSVAEYDATTGVLQYAIASRTVYAGSAVTIKYVK